MTAKIYRLAGILTLAGCWWLALRGGLLQIAVYGFLGILVFIVTWFIAAWEDGQKEDTPQ